MYKNKGEDGRNNISGNQIMIYRKQMDKPNSQRALAERMQLLGIDIDKNAVQRIESGQRFVTDIELKGFAELFGVSADRLLLSNQEEG
ncbi:MAG: helix-turn-helix transcriptional regulator [Clostridia bacterium]|nr:helix-turn-helix transcriptional regulator [Clostridia bacterium]